MVWYPMDAEDVTINALLKIITRLATFKGERRFHAWVYRIVANHVINLKRSAEEQMISFDEYWAGIKKTPNQVFFKECKHFALNT